MRYLMLMLSAREAAAIDYAAARCSRVADGEFIKDVARAYLDKPRKIKPDAEGAKEFTAEEFDKFNNRCARCGFEWD